MQLSECAGTEADDECITMLQDTESDCCLHVSSLRSATMSIVLEETLSLLHHILVFVQQGHFPVHLYRVLLLSRHSIHRRPSLPLGKPIKVTRTPGSG